MDFPVSLVKSSAQGLDIRWSATGRAPPHGFLLVVRSACDVHREWLIRIRDPTVMSFHLDADALGIGGTPAVTVKTCSESCVSGAIQNVVAREGSASSLTAVDDDRNREASAGGDQESVRAVDEVQSAEEKGQVDSGGVEAVAVTEVEDRTSDEAIGENGTNEDGFIAQPENLDGVVSVVKEAECSEELVPMMMTEQPADGCSVTCHCSAAETASEVLQPDDTEMTAKENEDECGSELMLPRSPLDEEGEKIDGKLAICNRTQPEASADVTCMVEENGGECREVGDAKLMDIPADGMPAILKSDKLEEAGIKVDCGESLTVIDAPHSERKQHEVRNAPTIGHVISVDNAERHEPEGILQCTGNEEMSTEIDAPPEIYISVDVPLCEREQDVNNDNSAERNEPEVVLQETENEEMCSEINAPSSKGDPVNESDNHEITANFATGQLNVKSKLSESDSLLTARIDWTVDEQRPSLTDVWMISVVNLSWRLNDESYDERIFEIAQPGCRKYGLPLWLNPGNRYHVIVRGLCRRPALHGSNGTAPNGDVTRSGTSTLIYHVTLKGDVEFRAGEVLTMRMMKQLLGKAVDYVQSHGTADFKECDKVRRDKSWSSYFEKILAGDGIMHPYLKDPSGDERSPINGEIEGMFFMANELEGRDVSQVSPFGDTRLSVPIHKLMAKASNVYFADFYCTSRARDDRDHYITLVLTKTDSEADRLCAERLPMLSFRQSDRHILCWERYTRKYYVTDAVWVELFYTEELSIRKLFRRGACSLNSVRPICGGSTTQGGKSKHRMCPECWVVTDGGTADNDESFDEF